MGSEQHYSLRWNDYTVKIVTAFQSLRDEEDFVDVTVACDGHSYSAHKMVLSACSPYFRALLRANPCQHPIVILKDVGHVELERLLEFMYNGEVSIAQDQLATFLRTAENLKIRGLAGSSDEMDQAGVHRPDVSYSYGSTSAVGGGLTSGRSSPSAGYAPSQESKDDDVVNDPTYQAPPSQSDTPPTKRRKRSTRNPAASHTDPNAASHTTEGVVTDATVDVDAGGTLSGGDLPGEEDSQSDRKMKSEPGDAMAEMYSESSEMSTDPQSHPGDGMDHRQSIMYPIAMPGPSGGSVGSGDNATGTHETGGAVAVAAVVGRKLPRGPGCQVCGECGKTFQCRDSLRRHHKIHRGTALSCPGCTKVFVQRGDLTRHVRRRHPDLAPVPVLLGPYKF